MSPINPIASPTAKLMSQADFDPGNIQDSSGFAENHDDTVQNASILGILADLGKHGLDKLDDAWKKTRDLTDGKEPGRRGPPVGNYGSRDIKWVKPESAEPAERLGLFVEAAALAAMAVADGASAAGGWVWENKWEIAGTAVVTAAGVGVLLYAEKAAAVFAAGAVLLFD